MYFYNFEHISYSKKKHNRIERYLILFLVLITAIFYRVFAEFQDDFKNLKKESESVRTIITKNNDYKRKIASMTENTSFLTNLLSSDGVNGQINQQENESHIILSGNGNSINNIIDEVLKNENTKILNIEFFVKGSENKEVKITFGEK